MLNDFEAEYPEALTNLVLAHCFGARLHFSDMVQANKDAGTPFVQGAKYLAKGK